MKYFGLAAAALVMTMGASAGSIAEACTPFSASAGTSFFVAPSLVTSGTSNCAAFSALPVGDTFVSVQIVLQSDYTGGNGITTNQTQTTFGGTFADVLNVSGTGTSSIYSDSFGSPNDPGAGATFYIYTVPGINSGNYTNAVNETYSDSVVSGSVQGVSGQIGLILNYSTSAPEPGSMMLLGGGLLAAGLIGRKKLVRK